MGKGINHLFMKQLFGLIILIFGLLNYFVNFLYYIIGQNDLSKDFFYQSIWNSFIPQLVGSILLINTSKKLRRSVSGFGVVYFTLGFLWFISFFYEKSNLIWSKKSFYFGMTSEYTLPELVLRFTPFIIGSILLIHFGEDKFEKN